MTSEHSNIVNLRDALPPLQQVETAPPTAAPAPRRTGMSLRDKVIFALILVGSAITYVGYTGQWPNVFIATSSTSDGGIPEPTLHADQPAPPQPGQQINPPSAPSRDVLYSINVHEPATNHDESVVNMANPGVAEVTDVPVTDVVPGIAVPPQSAAPMSASISPRITSTPANNDLNIPLQNQARIEAIEGYIVEMLTVIESHKKELASIHTLLEKNSLSIEQQMQRVNTLLKDKAVSKQKPSTSVLAVADQRQIRLPFRLTSIRQFGETLSIRIEGAASSRLLIVGQRHAGWELVGVDPDRRQAEFIHIDSRTRQVASL